MKDIKGKRIKLKDVVIIHSVEYLVGDAEDELIGYVGEVVDIANTHGNEVSVKLGAPPGSRGTWCCSCKGYDLEVIDTVAELGGLEHLKAWIQKNYATPEAQKPMDRSKLRPYHDVPVPHRLPAGHRNLQDIERCLIRMAFLVLNGQVSAKHCVLIHKNLPSEVAIFQVTGFITYLHREVALKRIKLDDPDVYVWWIRNNNPNIYLQYTRTRRPKP